jgi:hypothetical protein
MIGEREKVSEVFVLYDRYQTSFADLGKAILFLG